MLQQARFIAGGAARVAFREASGGHSVAEPNAMRRWLALGLAAACWVGAALVTPPGPRPGAVVMLRDLVRPLLLPYAWHGFVTASHAGRLGEAVARGRELLRLLPDWSDGHVAIAAMLAFDASQAASDPDTALDRLLAGLAVLREARTLAPRDAARFLVAEAFLAETRAGQDPAVAAAFQARLGQSAWAFAEQRTTAAVALSSALSVQSEQAYVTERAAAHAFRAGDRRQAQEFATRAQQRFTALAEALQHARRSADAAEARRRGAALGLLARHLAGDPGVSLDTIEADPYLKELLQRF